MGRRGPQPRSEEEHRFLGSYRGDRHANLETRPALAPEPGMRKPPESLDEEGRLVWWDLSVRLLRSGALALTDYYTLTVFCETWSRWRNAIAFVKAHGESYLVRDKAGQVKGVRLYPQVKLANTLADQLGRLGTQLGLSPASRGRTAALPDWSFEKIEKFKADQGDLERGRMNDPLFEADRNGSGEAETPSPPA